MSNYSNKQKVYLKKLGNNIREARNKLEISQEEFAFRADLDRTYIGGVERGERNISILTLQKLADALKVNIKNLIDN